MYTLTFQDGNTGLPRRICVGLHTVFDCRLSKTRLSPFVIAFYHISRNAVKIMMK